MRFIRPEEWWRLRAWQWEKQRRHDRTVARHRQRGFIINPFVFAAAGGTDPYFANVISLAHFDGSNGQASPFDDVVRGAGAWTQFGASATLSTGVKKFGSASMNSGSIGVGNPDHADWDFGSGDFTLEGWIYLNAVTGPTGNAQVLFTKGGGGAVRPFLMFITATTTYPNFYSSHDGTTWGVAITQTALSMSLSTWYHYAVTRSGNDHRMFIDGTQYGSTATLSGAVMTNSLQVGIGGYDTGANIATNGYIDETRATKGVARYTSNFSPPTAAFPDS